MYKIYFNLKSFDLNCLNQVETFLLSVFFFFYLNQPKQKRKPTKLKKITVLRSPHIDKKSREHFQISSHKKTLILTLIDQKKIFLVLEIIKNLKLIGVELELLIEFSTFYHTD
jgi:small subunit ribosomal protein S10